MNRGLQRAVRLRAHGCCEYCRLPQAHAGEQFNADHVIAQQHLGPTSLDNLAFACARCNRHKGPNLSGRDPISGQVVPLFNPRQDQWATHFAWNGPILEGLTATGRVTIQVLDMNNPQRVFLRSLLIELGVFPPRIEAAPPEPS